MSKIVNIEKYINSLKMVVDKHSKDADPAKQMTNDIFRMFLEDLEEIPSIEAEPIRHGHWEELQQKVYGFIPDTFYVCSVCNTEYDEVFMAACCADMEHETIVFPYCPYCGAKMDKEIK